MCVGLEKTAEDVVAIVLEDEETRSLNNGLAFAFTFSSFVTSLPFHFGRHFYVAGGPWS